MSASSENDDNRPHHQQTTTKRSSQDQQVGLRFRSRLSRRKNGEYSGCDDEDAESEDDEEDHNDRHWSTASKSQSNSSYLEDSLPSSVAENVYRSRPSSLSHWESYRRTDTSSGGRTAGITSNSSTSYINSSWYQESDTTPTTSSVQVLPYSDVFLDAAELIGVLFESFKQRVVSPSRDCSGRTTASVDGSLARCVTLTAEWATPASSAPPPLANGMPDITLEATADRVIRAVSSMSPDNADASAEHNESVVYCSRRVTIFAGLDPDSVCCVSLLKESLSERFGVECHIIPISCYSQLRHAFAVESSRSTGTSFLFQSASLFFINAGSRRDVRELMQPGFLRLSRWLPRLFVIDYHRPVAPHYFIASPEKVPCVIVSISEELERMEAERRRIEKLVRQSSQNRSADDLASDEEDDFIDTGEPTLDQISCIGEYNGPPSCLVFFEALRRHSLETPGMFFVVATALGYHLLTGSLHRRDYARHLHSLQDGFNRMRRRCWRTDRDFDVLKTEPHELLIPLLRFTSIEDALRHSALFLRAQTSRFATVDVIEHELASLRVQLALQEGGWKDQFRFLAHKEQKRLLRRVLPDVLKNATLTSRRRLPRRYPDDEETQNLVSVVAFVRLLSAVGLPDRVSSIDVAFLLLSLLSRPCPTVSVSSDEGSAVRGDSYDIATAAPPGDSRDAPMQPCSFRPLHETHGYSQPLFGRPFVEALQLLESLAHAVKKDPRTVIPCAASTTPTEDTDIRQPSSSGQMRQETSLWFLGNVWDAYVGHAQSVANVTVLSNDELYQSLARLTRVALQLQRDMMRLVLCVLEKRRPGFGHQTHYRRAVGNVEGFVQESVPPHLYRPLLLRYSAAVTADCIARGVCSALPDVLLLVAAPPNCMALGSIILGFAPNATMRTPSKLGLYIQDRLESLKLSGMLDNASQDDFDASLAYIPNNKLHTVFSALFSTPQRSSVPRASVSNISDVSSSDSNGGHSEDSPASPVFSEDDDEKVSSSKDDDQESFLSSEENDQRENVHPNARPGRPVSDRGSEQPSGHTSVYHDTEEAIESSTETNNWPRRRLIRCSSSDDPIVDDDSQKMKRRRVGHGAVTIATASEHSLLAEPEVYPA